MPQEFNGTYMGNGKLPGGGGSASVPSTPSGSNTIPSAVQQSDGLNSPRVTVQTLQAADSRPQAPTPAGPKGVQTFKDSL